jgi:uncharacterized protein (TIGR03435 family)
MLSRHTLRFALTTVTCVAIFGVVNASAQTFEAASVRPSDARDKKAAATPRTWGEVTGKVNLHNIPLNYLLQQVYSLQPDQLDGPSWLSDQFFDILATAPAGTPKEQITLMFQSLLAERFGLKFHRETHTAKIFALVVGKGGSKLKEALPADPGWKEGSTGSGAGETRSMTYWGTSAAFGRYTLTMAGGNAHVEFHNMTLGNLAQYLSQPPQVLGFPAVDMTELKGPYQIALDFPVSALSGRPADSLEASEPDLSGGSIPESLHKMGLDIVRRETQNEKFVIDHIEKTPTPN